jgi:hypothetical protein
VDAPGKDGNASMPEQVKRPNPWKMMMILIIIMMTICILKVLLTTTTGSIDSLTYIIQPYAH